MSRALLRRPPVRVTQAPPSPNSPPAPAPTSSRWLLAFVAYQMVCQAALVLIDLGSFRTVLRVAAFGISLAFLAFVPGRERRHPARGFAIASLVIVGLSLFHPDTDGWVAGVAQVTLYLAILAPLFWASRLRLDPGDLRRTLGLLWTFHAVGSALGVLQVYFPGEFQPQIASVLLARTDGYLESLTFEAASGARVFRPMGLTDAPGGAATNGHFAVLLGIGFFLSSRNKWFKLLCVTTMVLGMASVYMSHVRVALVTLAISLVAVGVFFGLRGQLRRFFGYAAVLGLVAAMGLSLALGLGGDAVSRRLNTLVSDDPSDVYYSNRGHFLESTVEELLPQHPLGAGLARWGMMNAYFSAQKVPPIWVEIQWTGWLLDGGVPLVISYFLALMVTMWTVMRIALGTIRGPEELWIWATIIFGYNLGSLAITFSYPLFIGQGGMEFWLLNAALFAAVPAQTKPTQWVVPRAPFGKLRRV